MRGALAGIALAAALIGAGVFSVSHWPAWELRSAETRLAEAYGQQRLFEFRLAGGAYVPVQNRRDNERSAFAKPIVLLEAENRIAGRLARDPDNVEWLRLRARAEMLDRDYDAAVSTLKRASDARPEDVTLLGELGCAYALRAEGQQRAIDYGAALEMLWRFLRARPDSPVALFNRAVVYERMFLYADAVKDWEHYLELDPAGGWADEARGRKQAIERKMLAREQAVKSLASAAGYLEAVQHGRAFDPEFYLQAAMTSWLSAAASDASAAEAVKLLGRLLKETHKDPWLEDLLRAKPDARYWEAAEHLVQARRHNLAEHPERGLEEARRARRSYREAGTQAGEVWAKYEELYALSRSMELKNCRELAGTLVREAAALHYGWILGQALMEEGNCRVVADGGGGKRSFEQALAVARAGNYKTLELRAVGLQNSEATTQGNQVAVWQQITKRLAAYWEAPNQGRVALQCYRDLSLASVTLGYQCSAFVFRRAGAEAIAMTGNQVQEAYSRTLLASLADAAGLRPEADREFSKASELFDRCCRTGVLTRQRFAAEVSRAQSQVKYAPEMALRLLEKILPSGEPFPTQELDTKLIFYQTQGSAKLMLGDLEGAAAAFQQAIQCNEQRLASLPAGADRSGPLHKSEDAYRGAVHVRLAHSAEEAFTLWESYRSADLAGAPREFDLRTALERDPSEVVLSYAFSPLGSVSIWILEGGAIECRRLSVRREQLEPVVTRFLRQCADPKAPLGALQRDARLLYDWLIAPVADRLRPGRVHIIEPDGPIGAIPLQALMDPAGKYLGESFPMVVSRGLIAYSQRRGLKPLTRDSTSLVIANPALGSEMATSFPPLADAAREAGEVAALFPNARLLSGKASTLEALESARPGVELFHFAGHTAPLGGDAGLLLAPSGKPGGFILRGSALIGQDWSRCSLAVLSACSTGTGERNGFVNPESMVRAFLIAGAGRVIASRWSVDTAATAGLMRHFYQAVFRGALPSSALREAAESLRLDPATAHPHYWAAFQLFGFK